MSTTDVLNRYLFEQLHVRGELVQLEQSYQQMIANHDYPLAIRQLLGELMAATSLLTATLKFEGEIAIQLQGDGPVTLAVINGDHQQQMRGVARFQEGVTTGSLKEMFGKGTMVITISPNKGKRYQGIVSLDQDNLAQCLESYFNSSEQLATRIWLFADTEKNKAAGSLIQILPDSEDKNQLQQDFSHIESLTETIKAEEIHALDAQELLYRLYHQESVRIFEPQSVSFKCSCSEDKCLAAIANLSQDEIQEHLATYQQFEMTCDYCLTSYHFDETRLAPLLTSKKH
jgi:molecular chaperone Hsp33